VLRGELPLELAGHLNVDARRAHALDALPGHQGIRVHQGHHHPLQTRGDQGVTTRRRAAVVRAGLQRDVGRRAPNVQTGLGGGAQSDDFRVGTASPIGAALHHGLSTIRLPRHQPAVNTWVRIGTPRRVSRGVVSRARLVSIHPVDSPATALARGADRRPGPRGGQAERAANVGGLTVRRNSLQGVGRRRWAG